MQTPPPFNLPELLLAAGVRNPCRLPWALKREPNAATKTPGGPPIRFLGDWVGCEWILIMRISALATQGHHKQHAVTFLFGLRYILRKCPECTWS
jgi:hypothetical protein